MKHSTTIIIAAAALIASCSHTPTTTVDTPAPTATTTVADTMPQAQVLIENVDQPAPKPATQRKTTATTAKKQQPKGETIYIETEGAQGRVWGHVTLNGDHGTGTIHDWDENTLTVSVTRHGNELYAVDQNSRQYVFKLKK